MRFININSQTFIGKLIGIPFRFLPKTTVVPILQGRLKGKKWIIGAGTRDFWTGTFEFKKRFSFEQNIKPGMVVYDIGANVGYYSMLASLLVKPTGKVFAFEPVRRNIDFIKRHIALNHLTNIEIIDAAVSDHNGTALFDTSSRYTIGHLSDSGNLEVTIICLDDFLIRKGITPPDVIKIDVEGGEFDVIKGANQLIEKYHPTIFLETHGRDIHEKTINLLKEHDYRFEIFEEHPEPFRQELIAIPKINKRL